MNFLQRIKTGRLFFNQRKNKEKTLEEVPDVITKFIFKDYTYILEEFDISFEQELNHKGQPAGHPSGGIMSLTIKDIPDYSLNEWILRDNILHNGEIRIFSNTNRVESGALLIIKFIDAYCIHYKKQIRSEEDGLSTTFTISPRYVKIGNEEFENRWKNKDKFAHDINIYSLNKE